jgi:hypothetical protein
MCARALHAPVITCGHDDAGEVVAGGHCCCLLRIAGLMRVLIENISGVYVSTSK